MTASARGRWLLRRLAFIALVVALVEFACFGFVWRLGGETWEISPDRPRGAPFTVFAARTTKHAGAVRLSPPALAERGSLECLVRPTVNPVLSDYFVSLTGITNEDLDASAMDLP